MAGGGIKINNNSIRGGADGATFTPHYDEATGYISWTNNKNYPNPEPMKVKGKDGKDGVNGTNGKNGEKGATGAKIIGQYLSGTDENGGNIYTQIFDDGTTAHFTAPKGEKGDDGEDAFVEIVQSTGYSQGAVMSQKAVTDRFDDINSSINEITVELDDKFSKRQISPNLGYSETEVTSQKGVTQSIELLETRIENTKTELNDMDLVLLRQLDEKLDIHDIVFSLGDDDDKVMSQSAVTRELDFTNMRLEEVKEKANNSISKSQITQETGDSEVRIMSQKAVTDALPRLQYAETERLPDHTSSLVMNAIGGLVGGQTYVVRVYRKPNFVDAPVTIRVETQYYGGETILLIENNTDETITARFTVPDTVVAATGHLFYGDGGTATHEFYLDTEHNELLKELEIVQETGSANDKIMSQRATTEKLNEKVNEDIFREELDKKADSSEVITLEKRVTNLEGATLATTIDDTIAYRKTVPNGVAKYALVDSVGGMSYKSNNLQYYPYWQTTRTYNGITYTDNGDGSVTLNNTATNNSHFQLSSVEKPITLQAGTYIVSGGKSNDVFLQVKNADTDETVRADFGTGGTFTLAETTKIRLNIYVKNGVTVSNVTIYPMLNSGTTVLPYEPYFEGLRHSKVTELVGEGENILNMACPESIPSNTASPNTTKRILEPNTCIVGISRNNYYLPSYVNVDVRTNNSFTLTIATTGYGLGFALKLNPNTEYTVSCDTTARRGTIGCGFYDNDGNYSPNKYIETNTFTFTTDDYGNVLLLFSSYDVETFTVSNIMLTRGTEFVPYKEYVGTLGTLEIPEAVQALEGWGLGVSAEYNNHIEKRGDKWIYRQEVYEEILDGITKKVNHMGQTGAGIYYGTIWLDMISVSGTNLIASHFDTARPNGQAGHIRTDRTQLIMYNYDQTITTADAWNEWLQNNPVTIVYAIAEPIETDITHLFTQDNFLAVEGGGTITAVNEHENAVPTAVAYITKL